MSHEEKCKKVEAALNKRGFRCQPCPDDDADMIVRRANGQFAFKLQVWGSLVFSFRNEQRKDIHVALCKGGKIYCYPHNEVLEKLHNAGRKITKTRSWKQRGFYAITKLSGKVAELLEPYRIHP